MVTRFSGLRGYREGGFFVRGRQRRGLVKHLRVLELGRATKGTVLSGTKLCYLTPRAPPVVDRQGHCCKGCPLSQECAFWCLCLRLTRFAIKHSSICA